MYSAFAANTGQADAAKWRAQVAQEPAIDPSNSGAQLLGDPVAALEMSGPARRGDAIFSVIGESDGLLFGIEWGDVANRTEDFLLDAARGFGEARQNCRLEVKTV